VPKFTLSLSWLGGAVLAAVAVFAAVGAVLGGSVVHRGKSIGDYRAEYARPDAIPFPEDNPYSRTKWRLGEKLFFEPLLSRSGNMSCATCHDPAFAWGDGRALAKGYGGSILARRTPTVLNAAWLELMMWDGRAATLEEQALGPIVAAGEMNLPIDEAVARLEAADDYRALFAAAFPGEGITAANLGKAIATYERTVVSGMAPFDRWVAGDERAISESAKRGFYLFNTKANCAVCHSGWNFSDGGFYDIGLADTDVGRIAHLRMASMNHAFKTPTLRDVTRRAPYMHNGSLADLQAVMEHYNRGGAAHRTSLSPEVRPLSLSTAEVADLIAFMQTLTAADAAVPVAQQE
jgi:cytochrome c peroxidase